MGGVDKGLMEFRGRPLVAYALDALGTVAGRVLVSANRNQEAYGRYGHPVLPDQGGDFEGPLAGLLAAMRAADTPYVLTAPCDAPLISGPLLARLPAALAEAGAELCAAHDGVRLHPVFLLAERRLADDLAAYLASGQRKMETWLRLHRLALADFADCPEALANLNQPDDLAALEASLPAPPAVAG
jgi:molybdopterin-guanine dinucleotide biosynthesis protein A